MTEQERAEIDAKLAALRDELLDRAARPVCVTVERACELFGFSRPTFERWKADPTTGLMRGPEPAVLQPDGPGCKVLVHVERMEAWLVGRGARRGA